VIRQLKYLEKTERIRIESGPQGTLITICKWKEYQSDYLEDETQVEQERYASESTNEYTTGSTGETTDESTTGPLLNKEQLTINKEQRTKKSSAQGPNLEMGTPVLRAVEKASPRRGDQGFCLTTETWQAYLEAFSERWQVEPKWNATVGGQLAHFIRRVGREDAPHVARFYMLHDDRGYVKNMHPVGWMLKDAEKLYAEWKSGKQVTQLQAASVEKASNYVSMLKRIEQGAL
jgi:hypothetical protein